MSTNVSQQSTPDFRELLASLSQPLRVTMDTLSGPILARGHTALESQLFGVTLDTNF